MRIAFLYLNNMLATSALNAQELWHAAAQIAKAQSRDSPYSTNSVKMVTVAPQEGYVTTGSGARLVADRGLENEVFDLIYVPALWRNPRAQLRTNQHTIAWLKTQYENNAILTATGTGVCFLAEAGLLDGAAATTHWHYFDQFAKDYPKVLLKRQHFITETGRLYCAGSINALTDLTIHHVHRHFGRLVADHLAQHFSAEARQPFSRLSFNQSKSDLHPDEDVLQIQLWIQDHCQQPNIEIKTLAADFGFSERNLNRRFKEATGKSPKQYLLGVRHQAARDLLKKSNLAVNEVAARVGYLDASHFTRQFKSLAGQTPLEYRLTQRAQLFDLNPN